MSKRALVTGASEGIGRAFSRQLAQQGYTVTLVARSADQLREFALELGPEHSPLVADLATDSGRLRVVGELATKHYDLLVNNAGAGLIGDFTAVPLESTLAMMHLNCDAVVWLTHVFLRQSQPGDALINVSSALSYIPCPTMTAYAATKAFVTAFSHALWQEQRTRGVLVLGLCPGLTATDFYLHAGKKLEQLPQWLFQPAERVVRVALDALARRKGPIVFCGVLERWLAAVASVMPRRLLVAVVDRVMRMDGSWFDGR